MKNDLSQNTIKLNKKHIRKKRQKAIVRILAIIIVFCTTYALILPAITLTEEPLCGFEEHAHSEECYTARRGFIFVCNPDEQGSVAHSHEEICYDSGELICELAEAEVHMHEQSCYETKSVLRCELSESEHHVHDENCCDADGTLICELAEADMHTHDESCCDADGALICEFAEAEMHTHDDTCYESEEALHCELSETITHVHTEECKSESDLTLELICEKEEHTHNELCYPANNEETDQFSGYLCGSGEHTHSDECSGDGSNVDCTIPEHIHDASCLVEDLSTEVEDRWAWESMINDIEKTGNWPTDILAVAEKQIGYAESEKNLVLIDGELKGYTRYGDWFGEPHGDWNGMFAAFVLNYAGVTEYPYDSDAAAWMQALKDIERFDAEAVPQKGNLIFTDEDEDGEADRIGVTVEMTYDADSASDLIKVIEGDVNGKVDYVTYKADDPVILGYGIVPAGDKIILEHFGEDYTVTASFGTDAGIPETALMNVREIPRDSDEYNSYYQQSIEALLAQNGSEANVSFARFFDIAFLVDGEKIEPTAAVDIKVKYADRFTIEDGNTGVAVHFADNGTEVLDAATNGNDANEADSFKFIQSSFSVSGTLVVSQARAIANTATRVNFDDLDVTGTEYIIYTQYNNRYYAIAAPASGKTGTMVEVQVSRDGIVTWNSNANLYWSFISTGDNAYDIINENGRYLHAFYNGNGSDIGVIGTNSKGASLISSGTGENKTFQVKHPENNVYVGISNGIFQATTNAANASRFYIAAISPSVYHVWFDGTDGGMMSYYGSDDTYLAVDPVDNTITLPTTWKSPTKYEYALNGWYDVKNSTYHKPGEQVTIDRHTVFYADWIAATYDVGQNNGHTVDSVDTNNFITTHVFDYNALFNALSLTHSGSISATRHTETWSIINEGKVPYNYLDSLGFAFVDYDPNGYFSYPLGRDNTNINQGDAITKGILREVYEASGKDLIDLLFNPNTNVIGKTYVGEGNYLFQYMDSTTSNYDGIHDGYYYLDARLNAASYNQSHQRFYLYDYLERTSDSDKDGGIGQYSDILPFNSPYLFDADQMDEYVDSTFRPGYEYDAKDGESSYMDYNSVDDAATNYFFGIRTDIDFFLPNDAGTTDEYGNYGNISTRGEHMIFDFHGDDDVWVFIDGELVLDIGGLHGVMFGQIDFSTGKVITGKDGGTTTRQSFTELLGHNITEGTHTMSVYYMERGSSQSNCAIYFNIAPRYDLEILKEDIVSAKMLDGAVFTIYNDEAMTSPAQLWDSLDDYNNDMKDDSIDDAKSTFKVVDGVAKCWGISAGKTYYIYETTPPPGYPQSDDMIRITLNNRGTATIETTTLHGANGVETEGYAVIKQEINETLKIVALTVTNQKEGDHTEVRVEKTWTENATNLPQSITVYLTADGVPVGRRAVLNEGNGWSYTWTGLDKNRADGIDQEIVYEVQEVLVPGFITTQGETKKVVNYVDWIRVDQMSDSKTFILAHNEKALTCNSDGFGWMDLETAELDESLSAQWNVTTDHDGFHLKNNLGYTLTYGPNGFYGIDDDAATLNQVFYYLNSRLVVHDHDVYYQFGSNGSLVTQDGLAFTLYQKEVMTGFLTNIINVPVDEEDQTYVEVNKVWSDGSDKHTNGSVIVRLYADGKDTGRYVTLSASNNWKDGFYDLPYYQEDGKTVVVYTVTEDAVRNYLPEYSEGTVLPGEEVKIWQDVNTLSAGEIYRFTARSYAMAVDAEDNPVSVMSDPEDTYQQWKAVSRNNGIVLQNVQTGRYLRVSGNRLSTNVGVSNGTAVTLNNGLVMIGQYYLEIDASHVGITSNADNISNQKISQYVTTTGKNGTAYTVTNIYGTYTLPQTGGKGTLPYVIFGGLLISVPLVIFITKRGRKQQRGGKHYRI